VLSVLLLAYILNFVDRQVLAMVAQDVKEEMSLTDTQLGILLGPAFVFFYTAAGIPIARLADRTSRRTVIGVGLALWSTMTVFCGAAKGFGQLALGRFGVGIGEAAGTPPSHSMISDYFPPERRATALSVYATGIYFGTGFGFAGGGLVLEYFDWRTAFYVAGLAGLPVVLLLAFTVREPVRGRFDAVRDAVTPPVHEVIRALFARRSFVFLLLAASCQAFLGYAVLSWGATFLRRVFDMPATEVGISFGLLAAISGAIGAAAGGALVDRLALRDSRWYAWLPAIVSLAAFPFAVGFVIADAPSLSLLAFAPFYLLNNMYVGPLWSLTQNLVRPSMRATASATLLAILNIVGYGIGPPLIGWISDLLEPTRGDDAIRVALLFAAFIGASASIFFLLCARTLPEDLEGGGGTLV
jgi:MFS family permease